MSLGHLTFYNQLIESIQGGQIYIENLKRKKKKTGHNPSSDAQEVRQEKWKHLGLRPCCLNKTTTTTTTWNSSSMETNSAFHFCQGHSAYTDGSAYLTPLAEEHMFPSHPSLLTDIWPPALPDSDTSEKQKSLFVNRVFRFVVFPNNCQWQQTDEDNSALFGKDEALLFLSYQNSMVREILLAQLLLARIHSSVCNFSEDPLSNLAWVWIFAKKNHLLTRWVAHCFQLIRDVLDNFSNEVWRLTITAHVSSSTTAAPLPALCFLCSYTILWVNYLMLCLIRFCSCLINLSHQPSFLNLLIKSGLLPACFVIHETF